MWSWIYALLGWTFPDIGSMWNSVVNLVASVFSYIDNAIQNVFNFIARLIDDLNNFISEVLGWIADVYNTVAGWVNKIYDDILGWVNTLVGDIYNYVNGFINQIFQEIYRLYNDVIQLGEALEAWVIRNIWNPLVSTITGIIQWINREGAFVFNLLTHPDQLAILLGKYLWEASFGLLARYSAPIGKWLLRTMIGEAKTIGGILEDIITSII